jgi:two-component system, NtrC family, response regulator AtoC
VPEVPHILVVDDDPAVGMVLAGILGQAGMRSTQSANAESALVELQRFPFDVIISDVRMPGLDGLSLLRRTLTEWPTVPVILLTGHGTIPLAVEAMRSGAADFLTKPFDREAVLFSVRKALAMRRDEAESEATPPDAVLAQGAGPMQEVLEIVRRVAPTSSTVLLLGETGTGKSLLAKEIHRASRRSEGPFVTVFCGALPEPLIESELFGHEKGAFTGAATRKPGRVEIAQGGTLFFDEIGELSPGLQTRLLRLLQDREFERVGGTETLKADVRFIAATHRDLQSAVSAGSFREDLYYRLSVVPVRLPPLRERPSELAALISRLLVEHAQRADRTVSLAGDALQWLITQSWPGNIRELQNFIERLVVLGDGPVIALRDVQREKSRPSAFGESAEPAIDTGTLEARRSSTERAALVDALRRASNNRTVAARLLGVSRRSLYNKLQEHQLE